MNSETFSLKAALLWSTIPLEAKTGILKAVWCGKCRGAVEIVDYAGTEKNGDIVLRGKCKVCGGPVCRVVETSEAPIPRN